MILFIEINKLPDELIKYIYDFIPLYNLINLNKQFYNLYHKHIKINKRLYDNYIRNIIRNDNFFVFETLLNENRIYWNKTTKIFYKNLIFSNYIYYLLHIIKLYNASNCQNILKEQIKKISTNEYKKKITINSIRWKH